jgi:hypothetical protein
MVLLELGQAVWVHATRAVGALVAVPLLAPGDPAGPTINTDQVLAFFASKIAPILLGVLGVIFIGRASKGEVSKVLTSSAIAIIGVGFIAGAAALFLVGGSLVQLFFGGK